MYKQKYISSSFIPTHTRLTVDSGQKRAMDIENKTASVSVSLPLGEGGPRSGG